MLAKLLKMFGYYKIDYGYSCGRHWVEIDGNLVAQSRDANLWLPDDKAAVIFNVFNKLLRRS